MFKLLSPRKKYRVNVHNLETERKRKNGVTSSNIKELLYIIINTCTY